MLACLLFAFSTSSSSPLISVIRLSLTNFCKVTSSSTDLGCSTSFFDSVSYRSIILSSIYQHLITDPYRSLNCLVSDERTSIIFLAQRLARSSNSFANSSVCNSTRGSDTDPQSDTMIWLASLRYF